MIQIDKEDEDLLVRYIWSVDPGGYLKAWVDGKPKLLHQVIAQRMGLDGEADHIDRDKDNYKRNNLRSATKSQQQWNKGILRSNTSGYIGVSWSIQKQKWVAEITFEGRHKYLNSHDSEVEAAIAYDRAAIRLRGDRAVLNFPKIDLESKELKMTFILTKEQYEQAIKEEYAHAFEILKVNDDGSVLCQSPEGYVDLIFKSKMDSKK